MNYKITVGMTINLPTQSSLNVLKVDRIIGSECQIGIYDLEMTLVHNRYMYIKEVEYWYELDRRTNSKLFKALNDEE